MGVRWGESKKILPRPPGNHYPKLPKVKMSLKGKK